MPAEKILRPGVFRVIHHAAAQHADFAQRIEDGDVGGGFGVIERVVVLGIEKARIVDGDDRGLALPLDARGTEVDDAFADEFRHALDRFHLRPQHACAKMHAALAQRQHLRQENALIDLDAILLALHRDAFGLDLPLRWRQPRHQFRRLIDEVVDPQEFFQPVGQLAIDGAGMRGEKALARVAAPQQDDIRRELLLDAALRLLRQLGQKIRSSPPEAHAGRGVALELVAELRPGVEPQHHAAMRQPGMLQNDARIAAIDGLPG